MKMRIKQFLFLLAGTLTVLSIGVSPAQAVPVDLFGVLGNAGFENGNLSGWTVTRPNLNYVASLSPPVNPTIDPADPANDPTTLTAPAGQFFTGLKRVGDEGPDLNYKLAHDAVNIAVPTGMDFQISVFANRGRLEPFDTPGSTGEVRVRIFGWTTNASTPTVTASTDNWSRTINWNPPSQSFNFTGVPDGTWGLQSFTFAPALQGINAADLKYLSLSLTGLNHNHDQYVASDLGGSPVPEPGSLALLIAGGLLLIGHVRFCRRMAALAPTRRNPNLSR